MKDRKKKSIFSTIIISIIITIIWGNLFYMALPSYALRPVRASQFQKACYSNIRIITGAIEMYNMDNENDKSKLIKNYDRDTLKILIENKYLKSEPELPLSCCRYTSSGDLYNYDENGKINECDGYVYCEVHGDLQGLRPIDENKTNNEAERTLNTNHIIKMLLFLGIILAPGSIYFFISI